MMSKEADVNFSSMFTLPQSHICSHWSLLVRKGDAPLQIIGQVHLVQQARHLMNSAEISGSRRAFHHDLGGFLALNLRVQLVLWSAPEATFCGNQAQWLSVASWSSSEAQVKLKPTIPVLQTSGLAGMRP